MPIYSYEYLAEGQQSSRTEVIASEIQVDSVDALLSYFDKNDINFITLEEKGAVVVSKI